MFICGSKSFSHQEEDKNGSYNSTNSTPKRSKRSKSFSKGKDKTKKNPYADRGLDKYLALLADLEDKKQKIYNEMGSEEISFIRFVYSNDSEHVKPIIVKAKNKNNKNFLKHPSNNSTITTNIAAATADASDKSIDEISKNEEMVKPQELQKEELTKRYQIWNGSFRRVKLKQPYYFFPVILVLILVFLAIYGRSFAIFCTSILWYLVPRIVGGSSSSSSSSSMSKPISKVSEKNLLYN